MSCRVTDNRPMGYDRVWLAALVLFAGATLAATGGFALWERTLGRWRKRGARERLLDRLQLSGCERLLDVGCGQGLELASAARRLRRGRAIGIDLWHDASIETALENVRRYRVADRTELRTADMRRLPFPDASFDAVVVRDALHALADPTERAQALGEIVRVLKPRGRVAIDDIAHLPEYAARLTALGCRPLPGRRDALLYARTRPGDAGSATPGV